MSQSALFSSTVKDKLTSSSIFTRYAWLIIGCSFVLRFFSIGANNLLVEEAYYWNYANHLDFSYLDHPPMIALLIRASTQLFGSNEFFIRLPALFCWLITAFFSYRLTNTIKKGAGIYAIMFLSIWPFFFLESLVITPDQPLMACWSAALYCLFRCLVQGQSRYWYATGLWIGLGMLSKYTIVLLGPAALLYLIFMPRARHWLTQKEPYLCLLIALIVFTPVIYWNATHEWVSFLFQSSRRFNARYTFTFHAFLGLILLFLMPFGVTGLIRLYKKKPVEVVFLPQDTLFFLRIFTIVPLVFFGLFSLTHSIKFNWIGTGLLSLIPWLAMDMLNPSTRLFSGRVTGIATGVGLLITFSLLILSISLSNLEISGKPLFNRLISWRELSIDLHAVAKKIEASHHVTPIFVPLDTYNINSEFYYYQSRLLTEGLIKKTYLIEGRHIFGADSLMYRYWSKNTVSTGQLLILVSHDPLDFERSFVTDHIITKSPVKSIAAYNQGRAIPLTRYYYQEALMKD